MHTFIYRYDTVHCRPYLELLHDVLFNILMPTDFEKEMFLLFSISILGRKNGNKSLES